MGLPRPRLLQPFGPALCHMGMRRTLVAVTAVCSVVVAACGTGSATAHRSATTPTARLGHSMNTSSARAQPASTSPAPGNSKLASADYTGSGTAHGCGPSVGPDRHAHLQSRCTHALARLCPAQTQSAAARGEQHQWLRTTRSDDHRRRARNAHDQHCARPVIRILQAHQRLSRRGSALRNLLV